MQASLLSHVVGSKFGRERLPGCSYGRSEVLSSDETPATGQRVHNAMCLLDGSIGHVAVLAFVVARSNLTTTRVNVSELSQFSDMLY
jgi:hypothetical protein